MNGPQTSRAWPQNAVKAEPPPQTPGCIRWAVRAIVASDMTRSGFRSMPPRPGPGGAVLLYFDRPPSALEAESTEVMQAAADYLAARFPGYTEVASPSWTGKEGTYTLLAPPHPVPVHVDVFGLGAAALEHEPTEEE